MSTFTWANIRDKVQGDLDLVDEDFITEDQLLKYANEGVQKAASEIVGLYEDYFLTKKAITYTAGVRVASDLPTNMYADKIRAVIFDNGSKKYLVNRIRRLQETAFFENETDDLRYLLLNDETNGVEMNFYPIPQDTSSTNMVMWYIRDAKILVNTTDVCDIPEFVEFVIQYMKMRCYEKEGHPNYDDSKKEMMSLKKDMVTTLENRVDDADTEIIKDYSFYEDFDTHDYYRY